jgi:RNA polymerase I-specific transcription initiation factor RRN3
LQAEHASVRVAAAAYLASFLARFVPLPPPALAAALRRVAAFVAAYVAADAQQAALTASLHSRRSWGPGDAAMPSLAPASLHRSASVSAVAAGCSRAPGAGGTAAPALDWQRHEVFHAAVQALLYALCYHMHTLQGRGGGVHEGGSAAELWEIVAQHVVPVLHSPLAPLATCLLSVAAEFARQLAALGGPDLAHLLPGDAERAAALRPCEMFFPFDPYLLPLSQPRLQLRATYRAWRRGHVVEAGAACAAAAPVAINASGDSSSDTSSDSGGGSAQLSDDEDLDGGTPPSASAASGEAPANPFSASRPVPAPAQPIVATHARAPVRSHGAHGSSSQADSALQGVSYASLPPQHAGGTASPEGGMPMSLSDPSFVAWRWQRSSAKASADAVRMAGSPDVLMGCTPPAAILWPVEN